MSDKTVGFIGVGRMGRHMSRRLLEAGHKLVAYDNNARALQEATSHGANAAHSPADVASQADIVLVSLPTPDIVKAVALGDKGVSSGKAVKVFIDLSTTGPKAAMEVAQALKEKGITAIDAPVSGGPGGADKGTLAVMVSGPKSLEKQVQPILSVIGKVFWVGEEPGMGQTMKVCNNLMSATAVAITSEALVIGTKAGLDPAIMLDVINAGSGRNTASRRQVSALRPAAQVRFRLCHRTDLKDVQALPGRGGAPGRPDGRRASPCRQLLAVTEGGAARAATSPDRPADREAGRRRGEARKQAGLKSGLTTTSTRSIAIHMRIMTGRVGELSSAAIRTTSPSRSTISSGRSRAGRHLVVDTGFDAAVGAQARPPDRSSRSATG